MSEGRIRFGPGRREAQPLLARVDLSLAAATFASISQSLIAARFPASWFSSSTRYLPGPRSPLYPPDSLP